jgi:hypothetical protein
MPYNAIKIRLNKANKMATGLVVDCITYLFCVGSTYLKNMPNFNLGLQIALLRLF